MNRCCSINSPAPNIWNSRGRIYGLPKDVARERTKELLELFELSAAQRKLIREYSKGMRKRVAMAASLNHRPQLFLMDERSKASIRWARA
ncbi:MAG: ATP-binding cassette domain-containing protein [Acidobacteriota bacterium]